MNQKMKKSAELFRIFIFAGIFLELIITAYLLYETFIIEKVGWNYLIDTYFLGFYRHPVMIFALYSLILLSKYITDVLSGQNSDENNQRHKKLLVVSLFSFILWFFISIYLIWRDICTPEYFISPYYENIEVFSYYLYLVNHFLLPLIPLCFIGLIIWLFSIENANRLKTVLKWFNVIAAAWVLVSLLIFIEVLIRGLLSHYSSLFFIIYEILMDIIYILIPLSLLVFSVRCAKTIKN